MDKELAQYINTLLAEKEREVKSKQDYLDKIDGMPVELIDTVTGERTNLDPEKYFVERQEIKWELSYEDEPTGNTFDTRQEANQFIELEVRQEFERSAQ